MGNKPHVFVIPFPAQGHVAPHMKLALQVASYGIRVTFLNTDINHAKLMASLQDKQQEQSPINVVSLPDGSKLLEGDQLDAAEMAKVKHRIRPSDLKEMLEEINRSNPDEQISCVVADMGLGWALELAKTMGVQSIGVSLPGPGFEALSLQVPRLIESGVLDGEGNLVKEEPISLSRDIPPWRPFDLPWVFHFWSVIETAKNNFGITNNSE